MKVYSKLALILFGIPGIMFILVASTQILESSTDPSAFLDFVTDTLGDTSHSAQFYAKFELCPISLDYGEPIDTAWWILDIAYSEVRPWLSNCGFVNTGCVISNILFHVDASGVPWHTYATPPIEERRNKFLLWAVTMFRNRIPEYATDFWPYADKTICVVDTVPNDDDYVTTDRFFSPFLSPVYSHMDDEGMNLQPADTFWVSLLFQAPFDLADLADTIASSPIIFQITAEPAASR